MCDSKSYYITSLSPSKNHPITPPAAKTATVNITYLPNNPITKPIFPPLHSLISSCANNKTPVPDGHFILTADRQEQHLLFCCHPCPVLRIPDLLFHDDAGLELYLYPVRRDYLDAGNQPSDKVVVKFRYLAAVSAQESIHVLHPLFIAFSQLFLFPCLRLFFFQGIDLLRDPAVAFIKLLRISACLGIFRDQRNHLFLFGFYPVGVFVGLLFPSVTADHPDHILPECAYKIALVSCDAVDGLHDRPV